MTRVEEISATPTLTVKVPASELTLMREQPDVGGVVAAGGAGVVVGVGVAVGVLVGVVVAVDVAIGVSVGADVGVTSATLSGLEINWRNLSRQVGFVTTTAEAAIAMRNKGRSKGITPFWQAFALI